MRATASKVRDNRTPIETLPEPAADLITEVMRRFPAGCLTCGRLRKRLAGFFELTPSLYQRLATRWAGGGVWRTWFIGARRVTTREAFAEFLRDSNASRAPKPCSLATRSPSARSRAHADAERELKELGA